MRQDTVFLRPSEFITLTSPSDAANVISVSNYNHQNNSIYLYSGRGYTTDGRICPDLAAPGVEIEGFTSSLSGVGNELRRVQRSGSSVAAAHMAGAAALFCQWTRESGIRYFSSTDVRTYLSEVQKEIHREHIPIGNGALERLICMVFLEIFRRRFSEVVTVCASCD